MVRGTPVGDERVRLNVGRAREARSRRRGRLVLAAPPTPSPAGRTVRACDRNRPVVVRHGASAQRRAAEPGPGPASAASALGGQRTPWGRALKCRQASSASSAIATSAAGRGSQRRVGNTRVVLADLGRGFDGRVGGGPARSASPWKSRRRRPGRRGFSPHHPIVGCLASATSSSNCAAARGSLNACATARSRRAHAEFNRSPIASASSHPSSSPRLAVE